MNQLSNLLRRIIASEVVAALGCWIRGKSLVDEWIEHTAPGMTYLEASTIIKITNRACVDNPITLEQILLIVNIVGGLAGQGVSAEELIRTWAERHPFAMERYRQNLREDIEAYEATYGKPHTEDIIILFREFDRIKRSAPPPTPSENEPGFTHI
jgi:hypothetical protein